MYKVLRPDLCYSRIHTDVQSTETSQTSATAGYTQMYKVLRPDLCYSRIHTDENVHLS